MNSFENFPRNATILVAICMIASFVFGWIISNNFYNIKIEQNSVEQNSNITLTVVDKGSLYESIFIAPTLCYLVLSNDETIYVSREDYQKYEVNQSYDFELLDQIYVTHRVKLSSANGS